MNFSQNPSLGSTPSALLTWLKILYNQLKIELLAINMNIMNVSRHFRQAGGGGDTSVLQVIWMYGRLGFDF